MKYELYHRKRIQSAIILQVRAYVSKLSSIFVIVNKNYVKMRWKNSLRDFPFLLLVCEIFHVHKNTNVYENAREPIASII